MNEYDDCWVLWRVSARIVQEETKLLESCKAQDPVNMNAEMTLRKKLNQSKKKADGGVKKDGKKKKKPSDSKKKTPPSKTKKASATERNKQKTSQQTKQLQEKEEKEEREDKQELGEEAHDGGKQESEQVPGSKGSSSGTKKSASKFSLQAAQKASKPKKTVEIKENGKKEQGKKNAEGQAKAKTKKAAEMEEETKDDDATAAANGEASEILTGKERSKERNRLTSQAYHKTFDLHKPKKSLLKSDPGKYAKLMDSAKAKARAAHNEEGKLFDEKHPRQPKENGGESRGDEINKQLARDVD